MSLAIPLMFAAFNLFLAHGAFKTKRWGWMGVSLAFASYAIYDVVIQLL